MKQLAYRHRWTENSRYFYYHAYCEAKNPHPEVPFEEISQEEVPAEAKCDLCYQSMHNSPEMKILKVNPFSVEISDGGYYSSVVLQGNGRLKCHSSRCKSRNHFTCEHVKFLQAQGVKPTGDSPLSMENVADLIDEE